MIKGKRFKRVGVIGFGGYVPKLRIKSREIAAQYGKEGKLIVERLGIAKKAVAGKGEDTVSLAVEAGMRALARAGIKPGELGGLLLGSESHPYAVKPTATIVAEILGVKREYIGVDLEFACKAGTTGLILMAGLIEAGVIELGMVIAADVAQSRPGDVLEYSAGAGAAAIILGNKKYRWWAKLIALNSFNADVPDFWRREGQKFPEHAGRFTGEPAYFEYVVGGTERFLKKIHRNVNEFDRVIFHAPNGKFPLRAAQKLKVKNEQLGELLVTQIGNPYSPSAMLQLIKVWEEAKKGEEVLLTSYGSGAGSDSFWFETKRKLTKKYQSGGSGLATQLTKTRYLNYAQYSQLGRTR